MNVRRTVLKALSMPLLASLTAMPAMAQDDYPNHPVTLVVPVAALAWPRSPRPRPMGTRCS